MARDRQRARARAWRTLLVAAALLLGVLAMHGVAPHSLAHADGGISALVSGTTHDGHAGHDGLDAHTHGPVLSDGHSPATDGPSDPDGGHEHGHGSELCLAFLCLMLALLAVVLALQPTRPMVILRRVRERLVVASRPFEPPSLATLSILRC